ncbi:MAG: hypothetical protein ONA69_09770 [candidate division KSB1 bacterium]|nr:hypothetical protein [candidate division KSB1 bacterium]MDZ7347064.1 hypothetical protein [candidate division KSB1 bacterium]
MKRIGWIFLLFAACQTAKKEGNVAMFKDDLEFLQKHTRVLVIKSDDERSQVIVAPSLQGRVMTSTADGLDGISFGWVNRELIASGENNPHINAYGGEDRFWLGPEGGQFSIFFKAGDPFDLEHWFTPPPINEGAYEVVEHSRKHVIFRKEMSLVNYSGTPFNLRLDRTVILLTPEQIAERFHFTVSAALKATAFESRNVITNCGDNAWRKETGLLSVWILGMYNPSPKTTIVIPFKPGDEETLGPKVNDAYFGKPPADRLAVRDSVLFFKGDGRLRSKIGINPKRAKNILGSYDADLKLLTLVTFNQPEGVTDYVNSMWEIQEEPYAGDVVNSYNDGPAAPGAKPMGPFYELETSSPAAALAPGQSLEHIHATLHLLGDERELDKISRRALGVSLSEIVSALP